MDVLHHVFQFNTKFGFIHINPQFLLLHELLSVIPTLKRYSDIVSDIPSGSIYGMSILAFYLILFDILSVIYFDILSGIYSGILSGIFSGIHSGILSGILCDILFGVWLRSGSAHWALELARKEGREEGRKEGRRK